METKVIQKDKPYVYYHFIGDKIFYVGCGKNERYATHKGRNSLWHRLVSEAGGFTPQIIRWFDSTEEALKFEKEEIKRLKPEANWGEPRKIKKKEDLIKTTNIRIYPTTHQLLKQLAEKRKQSIIVVLDELVKTFAGPFEETY